MRNRMWLLFGPVAALVFGGGIYFLALAVPGYSAVRQTVSEIGEVGSPARIPFSVLLCMVSACLLIFAAAVRDRSRASGRAQWAAYFIGLMAVSAAGVGIFAFPLPLHNVFGMSELFGYQAPLVFAITWRRDGAVKHLVQFSWLMFVVVWLALAVNMSSLAAHSAMWEFVKPVRGLVQRSLFAAWFCWVAVLGVALWRSPAFAERG
jgi:hypothetical membrane protein